jgi:hypothetical protein
MKWRETSREREEEKATNGVVMVSVGEDGGGEGGGESYVCESEGDREGSEDERDERVSI